MRSLPAVIPVSRGDLELVAALVLIGAVVSIPLLIGYATWSDHMALRDEWRIAGPPCPPAAEPWPVHKIKPKVFRYRGVSFERRYGAAYCEAVPDDGLFAKASHTVCQFAGPGQVTVTSPAGASRWEPGIGKHATITIRDGRPSCVVGGWWGY